MSRRKFDSLRAALELADFFGKPYLPEYKNRLVVDPDEAARLGVRVGHTLTERVDKPFHVWPMSKG